MHPIAASAPGGGAAANNNNILCARQHPRVFVVTTPANHLFGVHRHTREGNYQSCVFGFRDRQQADSIARSLESHYAEHGAFPSRDLTAEGLKIMESLRPSDIALRELSVLPLPLPDLLRRLRGTGIVVTLLSYEAPEGGGAFRCQDVYTDASTSSVVGNLNRAWHRTTTASHRHDADAPSLLPKPVWRGPARPGLLMPALAVRLLEFAVFVEAVTAFCLLPSLFL